MGSINSHILNSERYKNWNLDENNFEFEIKMLDKTNIILQIRNLTLEKNCNLIFTKKHNSQFKRICCQYDYFGSDPSDPSDIISGGIFHNKIINFLVNRNIIQHLYTDSKSGLDHFALHPRELLQLL